MVTDDNGCILFGAAIAGATQAVGLTEEEIEIDDAAAAIAYRHTLINLLKQSENIGNAMLRALWEIYRRNLICYSPDNQEYNPEDLFLWVENTFVEYEAQLPYLRKIVRVVNNVLSVVYNANNPLPGEAPRKFNSPTGMPWTIEDLLRIPVSRLIAIEPTFRDDPIMDTPPTHTQRNELLTVASSAKNRKEVQEAITHGVAPQRQFVPRLFYRVDSQVGGKSTVVFQNLSPEQTAYLVARIRDVADEISFELAEA